MGRAPRIAVVIPAYNHEAYIADAIASVLAQDWPSLELHVLDDGSTDGTLAAAEAALRQMQGLRCRLQSQSNAGAARTLNRLIESCDADLIAILNSDDVYMPGRLAALAACADSNDFLAFSGVAFDPQAMVSAAESFESWYRGKLAYTMSLPSCGFALVSANIAISTSNFVFSRQLFDRVGGFNDALPLTHDWEFLLKALRWTEPHLVPERLLYYRTHATNSFRALMDIRFDQSRRAHEAYASWGVDVVPNRLAPTPAAWPRFFPVFAHSCVPVFGAEPLAAFLPDAMLAPANRSAVGAAVEDAALRNLLAASRARTENLRRPTEELLNATAAQWNGVRMQVGHGR